MMGKGFYLKIWCSFNSQIEGKSSLLMFLEDEAESSFLNPADCWKEDKTVEQFEGPPTLAVYLKKGCLCFLRFTHLTDREKPVRQFMLMEFLMRVDNADALLLEAERQTEEERERRGISPEALEDVKAELSLDSGHHD